METLEALTSTVRAVEQQLTTTVTDLTGFMTVMDEQQDTRLTRLTSK